MLGSVNSSRASKSSHAPARLTQFKFAAAVDQIVFGKLANRGAGRSVTHGVLLVDDNLKVVGVKKVFVWKNLMLTGYK